MYLQMHNHLIFTSPIGFNIAFTNVGTRLKEHCSNVVPTLYNVARTLCNVVSTLFQRRALTLYQNWKRRILFRFQRRINVISTLFDPSLNCWPGKETNIGQWPYFNTNDLILQLESVTEIPKLIIQPTLKQMVIIIVTRKATTHVHW